MKDLKNFKKIFRSVKYETTWLCTLWIFFRFYFIERIDPNKERYWKRIIKEHRKLEKSYNFLFTVDKIIMKLFPIMRRFCWNIVIWAQK